MAHERNIAVIGLGYVGLPVAVAFARQGARVVGFDIDPSRIEELKSGHDRTGEVESAQLTHPTLTYARDEAALTDADFFVVTVPTPIDSARRPDLASLFAASHTVGRALKSGDIVVYESTVYPGAVEEDCGPILESVSGLTAGRDFALAYSPERINPGDPLHRFENITKIISAQDARTLEIVAAVYGSVVTAGLHRAPSIRVAEAAKVIENTQRDLNIALVNELSAIFELLGIDTSDVLAAAGTKWNFHSFHPGLVGGHCIGVDPYHLTYRAEKLGYRPEMILAGRRINDNMGRRIARECIRQLFRRNRTAAAVVTILGITFKENIRDTRNSGAADIVRELQSYGVDTQVHDPLASKDEVAREYGITLMSAEALQPADAVILAIAHRDYVSEGWPLVQRLLKGQEGIVLDVKAKLDRDSKPDGVELWRL